MSTMKLIVENAESNHFYDWEMCIVMPDGQRSGSFYLKEMDDTYAEIRTKGSWEEYEKKIRYYIVELCECEDIHFLIDEVLYFNSQEEINILQILRKLKKVSTSEKGIILYGKDEKLPTWRSVTLELV